MNKRVFFLSFKILFLLIFLKSCGDKKFKNQYSKNEIINKNLLKEYVDKFNKYDHELYKQFIDNKNAYKFLSGNIPIIEIPDKVIEEKYYFRWWTFRKHIKSTVDGFVITEFLPKVYWSKKHNTINCPAAHHIYEGRWLRNPKYISEYIDFWLKNSEDGIRQYSFWIADATLAFNKIHRNDSLLFTQLVPLISNYNEWEKIRKDNNKSLFWQWDEKDGMELTVSGKILNGGIEKSGVKAVRPTINSYMYGDAIAISKIAYLKNELEIGKKFEKKAKKIKEKLQSRLWNKDLSFFTVLPKNYNKTTKPLNIRELIGYVPWYFNLPDDKLEYTIAWEKLKDTLGFSAPYGLTVTERSHPFFKISYNGHECQWNGPSWPFATTQTLKAFANYLNNYSKNCSVSKDEYYPLLLQYAKSHKIRNETGEEQNWIDENLNPFTGDWISRTRLKEWENGTWSDAKGGVERGKDYNHSSFCDLVLNDLLGIKPKLNSTIEINPLIPDNWEWFAVKNVNYQGKKIDIVWDKSGEKYELGKGLTIFVNDIKKLNTRTNNNIKVKI
tara:strand:- start:2112 stop:3773 length:1662 start_codon:yes stop_codon:yes gene_type:complete